jgi:hypothetical protein
VLVCRVRRVLSQLLQLLLTLLLICQLLVLLVLFKVLLNLLLPPCNHSRIKLLLQCCNLLQCCLPFSRTCAWILYYSSNMCQHVHKVSPLLLVSTQVGSLSSNGSSIVVAAAMATASVTAAAAGHASACSSSRGDRLLLLPLLPGVGFAAGMEVPPAWHLGPVAAAVVHACEGADRAVSCCCCCLLICPCCSQEGFYLWTIATTTTTATCRSSGARNLCDFRCKLSKWDLPPQHHVQQHLLLSRERLLLLLQAVQPYIYCFLAFKAARLCAEVTRLTCCISCSKALLLLLLLGTGIRCSLIL